MHIPITHPNEWFNDATHSPRFTSVHVHILRALHTTRRSTLSRAEQKRTTYLRNARTEYADSTAPNHLTNLTDFPLEASSLFTSSATNETKAS